METKKRVNEVLENYKAYKESRNNFLGKFESARVAEAKKRDEFIAKCYKIRENREAKEANHGKLLNEARDYYFKNALKGIYIGALEEATLTDDAIFLAENMVDTYVAENGGYTNIMQKCKADTYLLAKIRRVVEDAAEEQVDNLEDEEKDIDDLEDIEIEDEAEDEKDSLEVEDKEEITTANIEDIVQALNQAGMEVVKKDDADNFKDEEPANDETAPEVEAPADVDTPEADSIEDTEAPVDNLDMNDTQDDATKVDAPADDTTAAPSTDVEEAPATTDAVPEENKEEEKEEEEEDELTSDLDAAEELEDEEEEDFEDTMDPDSVSIQDDEEDSDDDDLGDDDLEGLDDEEEEDDELSDDLGEDEESEDIDIEGDGDPDIGDIDEPEPTVNVDPNKTMMDELENEKEIQAAVELIRTRVADAEEAFIKRNQEDKEQIDALLSKISQNVATVEKISNDDSTEAAEAKKTVEESTIMFKKAINKITYDKAVGIFDKMTRTISESIIADPAKVNMFLNESGQPDMRYIVEASKVMYGFLETLNTLQLESVDSPYINKIINNLK